MWCANYYFTELEILDGLGINFQGFSVETIKETLSGHKLLTTKGVLLDQVLTFDEIVTYSAILGIDDVSLTERDELSDSILAIRILRYIEPSIISVSLRSRKIQVLAFAVYDMLRPNRSFPGSKALYISRKHPFLLAICAEWLRLHDIFYHTYIGNCERSSSARSENRIFLFPMTN